MMQFLWAIGMMIASYAIQALLTPKTQTPPPATLGGLNVPQISEGTPQIVVFGDAWIDSWQVLWYGNLRTSPVNMSGKK